MQVNEVTFMRRRNLGNYEHIEASASVTLLEGDSADNGIEEAKRIVCKALEIKAPTKVVKVSTTANKEEENANPEKAPAKAAKKTTKKKTTKKAPSKAKASASKEEVLDALRSYAKSKQSKELAQAVLEDVTGAKSLGEVDTKLYGKLIKALAV